MTVVASIVIDFASASSSYLTAEINSDDNNDKTTFIAGDPVYFRVAAEAAYSCFSSDGHITLMSTDNYIEEENLLSFTEDAVVEDNSSYTKSLSGLIHSIDSYVWYGVDYGLITQVEANTVQCNGGVLDIFPDSEHPGVCKLNYTHKYDLLKLNAPPGMSEEYAIVIVIKNTE